MCVRVRVCVCVREREREKTGEIECDHQSTHSIYINKP